MIQDDTRAMLRDSAARLLRERCGFEARRAVLAGPRGFSEALWAEYAALGFLGVELPEAHGGSDGGFAELAVLLEEFGRALAPEPFLPSVVLGGGLILAAGSAEQHGALLPHLGSGQIRLALAWLEPPGATPCVLRDSQGSLSLTGRKSLVLGGDCANFVIVAARHGDGMTLVVVPAGAPGVSVTPYRTIDDRGAADIRFDDVPLSTDTLLGPPGQGEAALARALDRGAAAYCCEAVGAMAALMALTLEHLKTRTQFGKALGAFQALQHRMADMAIAEQQARSLLTLAIAHADDPDPVLRGRAVSAAKAGIGEAARFVGQQAIQLHGGIGMTMEYAAGHFFRRLTAFELAFGTTAEHLDRYAALSDRAAGQNSPSPRSAAQ